MSQAKTKTRMPTPAMQNFGFPEEVLDIDETFEKKYEAAIEAAKKEYVSQGGIYILQDKDRKYGVIVRVPSKDILRDVTSRAQKLDPMDADMLLLGKCLIYPNPPVVQGWIEGPAPGLAMSFCKSLLELAKVQVESTVKKL